MWVPSGDSCRPASTSGLTPGTYNATITLTGTSSPGGNGVTFTKTIAVIFNDIVIKATINSPPPPIWPGMTVNLSCTTNGAAGNYNWSSPSGTPASQSGGSSYDVQYVNAGTYPVTCTDTTYNVSDTTNVTVVSPSCAYFKANPTTVVPPESTNLTWQCFNAYSCYVTDAAGNKWTGVATTTGSLTVTPTPTDNSYTLTCSGQGSGSANSTSYTTGVNTQGTNIRETNP